jgi:hypothetical protein
MCKILVKPHCLTQTCRQAYRVLFARHEGQRNGSTSDTHNFCLDLFVDADFAVMWHHEYSEL